MPKSKHETFPEEELVKRLQQELESLKDIRFRSTVLLLYIEYFLNEIIISIFPKPDIILNDKELGSFDKKVEIIKALDITENPYVLKNIGIIQRIRNYYSHTLIIEDKLPNEIESRIKEMEYIYILTEEQKKEIDKLTLDRKFDFFAIQTIKYLNERLEKYVSRLQLRYI